MTRAEYERSVSQERGHTVAEMRAMGYHSAMDPAPESCGWQNFAVAPGLTRREAAEILRQFTAPDDLHPQRFGEGRG